MFIIIVDIFSDDIFDYLCCIDINNLEQVVPCIVRMYKSVYLDQCLSYAKNMYVECSYCQKIDHGKYRKGLYVCRKCITDMISISIS